MWHQLVLHGIGGKTIAEAQRNITWAELQRWKRYIASNGSLDIGPRIEYGFALLAYLIANKETFVDAKGHVHGSMKKKGGKKFEIRDFMVHVPDGAEEERDFTPDDVLAAFGKGKK